MSYDLVEQSEHGGQPQEMYEFVRGTRAWRYASGGSDIALLGVINYAAVPIYRSSVERSGEMGKAGITITLPRDIDLVLDYVSDPPAEITTLKIWRQHASDPEVVVFWMGRVVNVEWSDSNVLLSCEHLYTSMQRVGLRRSYQLNCPHRLYGPSCGVSATAMQVLSAVTSVAGNVVNTTGLGGAPDGYFNGGYVTWSENSSLQYRMVISSTTSALVLPRPPLRLLAGQEITAFPGCQHIVDDCTTKFANLPRYGGFPHRPSKNPFGGTTLF